MMQKPPFLLGVFLVCGTLYAAPALAEKSAKDLFNDGAEALANHEYQKALEAFQAAYDTDPHWMVQLHIGNCYSRLNRPGKAIEAYEKFLREGGDGIPEDDLEQAREGLAKQQARVASLILRVKPSDTEVHLDGERLGKPPFGEILIGGGIHQLMFVRDDGEEFLEFDAEPGQEIMVRSDPAKGEATYELIGGPPEPVKEAPAEKEPTARNQERLSLPFFIAAGTAGAGLITMVVGFSMMGYFSGQVDDYAAKNDNLGELSQSFSYDMCEDGTFVPGTTQQDYCYNEWERRQYDDKRKTSLIVGVVGLSVTVLAGGTAALFYFFPQILPAGEKQATLTITPVLNARQGGLVLIASF
jgi:hypothetical protein